LNFKKKSIRVIAKKYFKLIADYYSANELGPFLINPLDIERALNSVSWNIHLAAFRMLCRYQSLYAPGYHAAIPYKTFMVLKQRLSVTHELFASPLNKTLDEYTSVYPDTDIPFGSKGNFFAEYPKLFERGGSFEANPPFLEEHMAALALIIIDSLLRYSVPLSFVVIVPAWTDTVLYHVLTQTKFNVLGNKGNGFLSLDRHKHFYRNGADYLHAEELRKSSNRTLIFILQNEAGKRDYPVTELFLNELMDSFISK